MYTKKRVIYGIVLLLIILAFFYFLPNFTNLKKFTDPYALRVFVLKFGLLAPFALITLEILQSFLSVLPFYGVTIAAGFVFGAFWGLVYALIGTFIGSALAFLVARRYGVSLLNRFIPMKDIDTFQKKMVGREGWTIFLARFFPIFPNNIISFAAGLTNMSFKEFNIISTIGFLFQILALTYLGEALSTGKIDWKMLLIIIILAAAIFLLLTQFRRWKKSHMLFFRKT